MLPAGAPQRPRAAKACVICHKKKIRCDLSQGQDPCTNCRLYEYPCKPRERKRKIYTISPSPPPSDRRASKQSRNGESSNVHQTTTPTAPTPQWSAGGAQWEDRRLLSGQTTQVQSPLTPNVATQQQVQEGSMDSRANTINTPSSWSHSQARKDGHDPVPGSSTSYLGRSEYLGVPFNDESYPVSGTKLSELDMEMLRVQHAFDLPPRSIRTGLIDNFFAFCAPWSPIVDRNWLEETPGHTPSILLLQAVFLAGSRVSSAPLVYASCEDFYRRAKALFFCGYEKNTIMSIVAVCLLHWWNPSGPEVVSLDTSPFWLRIAVSMAYQIGLHIEPPPGEDAAFRRRLWWNLVARDCLISAGQGRPRAINMNDSDILPLHVADFPEPNSSRARLFVAYVNICQILGDATECCLRKQLSRSRRRSFGNALYRWVKELPEEFRLFQRSPSGCSNQLNTYNFEARQLHVPYFVILMILNRASAPSAPPSAPALVASSFVCGVYEDFLARDELRFLGPIFTFYALSAGVTQLHGYRYASQRAAAEHEVRIIKLSLQELAKRWPSAVGCLKSLAGLTDTVLKQPLADHQGPTPATPETLHFYAEMGPDLCRNWALLDRVVHLPSGLAFARGPDGTATIPLPADGDAPHHHNPEMATASILADLRTPNAIVPTADATLPAVAPPSAAAVHHAGGPTLAGGFDPSQGGSGADGGDFFDRRSAGLWVGWDPVGSWLLDDWGIEVPW